MNKLYKKISFITSTKWSGTLLLVSIIFMVPFTKVKAQDDRRFGAGIKAGVNLAQIDGDNLFGFDQIGAMGGITALARINRVLDLNVEFLFSQRGSHFSKNDPPLVAFRLNYLEVPFILNVKDWLTNTGEKSYYRMHFQGGFSLGRLISSSSLSGLDQDFKKNDLSWLIGFNYYYASRWALNARYTRSLTPLIEFTSNNNEVRMISYFLSLGLQYRFNP
ncbi:MAG: PorT family protein [Bacteroidota bacterium]|nr:PorT family protein [Bacteroidota bacterium]